MVVLEYIMSGLDMWVLFACDHFVATYMDLYSNMSIIAVKYVDYDANF
jgi:hypothetical protein